MVKRIKIGDLISAKKAHSQTGPFGTQLSASEYVEEGYPVINVRNIGMGDIRSTNLEFVNEQKALELKSHSLKEYDIVFGRKGAVERHSLITTNQEGWIQGSDCIRLRFLSDDFNPVFVSYFFRTQTHQQWMINLGSFGATMGSLNQEIISKIEIPDIERSLQDRIAFILSSYDELIENNNQRIKLLEEIAEDIYKEWFVRFRFPGHDEIKFIDKEGKKVAHEKKKKALPEGWENKKLGDILDTVKRKPKVKKDNYQDEGMFPIIDQGNGLIAGYTDEEEYVQKEPLPILVFGDHTRRLKFINFPFACGADGTQLLFPKNRNLLPVYFYVAVNRIDLSNFHYSRHSKFLKREKILIPSKEILKRFNELIMPFYEQMDILRNKNKILRETRDLLLPRLISGKLTVEDEAVYPIEKFPQPVETNAY